MPLSFEEFPATWSLLHRLKPERRPGQRVVTLSSEKTVNSETLTKVAAELTSSVALAALNCEEIAVLARVAGAAEAGQDKPGASELTMRIRQIVASRWNETAKPLALIALGNLNYSAGRCMLTALPELTPSSEMIDALAESMEGSLSGLHRTVEVQELVIGSLDQARRILSASVKHRDDYITAYLVAALARGLGWTKWVKLFAVLLDMPELAGDGEVAPPHEKHSYDSGAGIAIRKAVQEAIEDDIPVRQTALLILDLDGALAYAGPDLRRAYLNRLSAAIGDDADLRCSAVEALLSRPLDRQRDLGLYVACALIRPEDERFVVDLIDHPDRRVGYDAQMVHEAVFGSAEEGSVWPRPSLGGIAEGLFQMRLALPPQEQARTWLGDRLLERMIEHTASSEEERFARSFEHRSEEGEEGLVRIFFADMAQQFASLDQGLLAASRATRSGRRTRISLRYRPINKIEEGKAGIGRNMDEEPPSFSADLCLIVDPYLDGKPLGKRATLVQAKRLRRVEPAKPERGLTTSYKLEPKQMTDLLRQTGSSFYLFQGPGAAGRGVPVIPTQLVADLAYHQSASGSRIDHAAVGLASCSFADWLTYDVIALRTGDPHAELVAKAAGGIGRRPRELGTFGTVEIEIRVGEPPKEGG